MSTDERKTNHDKPGHMLRSIYYVLFSSRFQPPTFRCSSWSQQFIPYSPWVFLHIFIAHEVQHPPPQQADFYRRLLTHVLALFIPRWEMTKPNRVLLENSNPRTRVNWGIGVSELNCWFAVSYNNNYNNSKRYAPLLSYVSPPFYTTTRYKLSIELYSSNSILT